jgi:hypothetical protein
MPQRIGLRFQEWPPADRAAWDRGITRTNYFDDAPASHWRPKTVGDARSAYGRWLAFVQAEDPLALDEAPGERTSAARLRRYCERLQQRISTMGVAAELQHLLLALCVLAPDQDWAQLRGLKSAYQKRAKPRDKRNRIVDPRRLLRLGLQLMEGADSARTPKAQARCFRDGLLIALLVCRPLRRRSLAALELGRNVQRVGDHYVLALDADDTKAGEPVEFDVPSMLTPYLSRYVEDYRSRFAGANRSRALWLSSKGGALCAEAVYDLVCRRTRDAFGFTIHPHLFRNIAATAIAREAPTLLPVAQALLTHAKAETTHHHYANARSSEAGRLHAATIAKLRSTSARSMPAATPSSD